MLQVYNVPLMYIYCFFVEGRPNEGDLRKFDGSVKKNTAFTKKLVS